MAGGLLTGKYRQDQKPDEGRFTAAVGEAGAMYAQRYWHEREFQTIEKLRALADESGLSLAKLSIAWVMANPVISAAIIGASRAEQLTETLAAADVKLDPDLKSRLDDLTVEYRWGDAPR